MAILRDLNLQSQQRGQDVPLENVQLALISAEMTRLEALFSADKLIRDQYAALTKRIGIENASLATHAVPVPPITLATWMPGRLGNW